MAKRHNAAIYSTLAGDATFMAMMSSATPARVIHAKQAPFGAVMPYAVFFESAGGRNNAFAGNHDDVYYTIKVVADADENGKAVAEAAADRIETLFHRPATDPALGDSWVLRAATVTTHVGYAETAEKKTYIHAGRVVRLRGDK
jgi:hypothetical protein